MPHSSMLDKVQVVAKQQYAQELAAYTLLQWNVARGAAEAHGKPHSGRPSADELASSQRRRLSLARAASALSSAASSSSSSADDPPPETASGSAPAVKAVDYAPLPLTATHPPASQASSSPPADDPRH